MHVYVKNKRIRSETGTLPDMYERPLQSSAFIITPAACPEKSYKKIFIYMAQSLHTFEHKIAKQVFKKPKCMHWYMLQ